MKYNVKLNDNLFSFLGTKYALESDFEIPVSDKDVSLVYSYLEDCNDQTLLEILHGMGLDCECYLTYRVEYDAESRVFQIEVLFDNNYFGFAMVVEDESLTVFNDLWEIP